MNVKKKQTGICSHCGQPTYVRLKTKQERRKAGLEVARVSAENRAKAFARDGEARRRYAARHSLAEILQLSVYEINLSVRSANCLQNANIQFIGELVRRSEQDMLKTKNFGRHSLKEIKSILSDFGLQLGMQCPEFGRVHRSKTDLGLLGIAQSWDVN